MSRGLRLLVKIKSEEYQAAETRALDIKVLTELQYRRKIQSRAKLGGKGKRITQRVATAGMKMLKRKKGDHLQS